MDEAPMDADLALSDRLRDLGIGLRLSADFVATTPRIAQLADRPDEPEARRAELSAAKADALDRARTAKAAWVDAAASDVEWEGTSRVRVDGCDVWLAYARERPPRGWSLGVPVAFEGEVVLLCEDADGDMLELSMSSRDLIDAGVSQSRGKWVVQVVRDGDEVRVAGGDRQRLSA